MNNAELYNQIIWILHSQATDDSKGTTTNQANVEERRCRFLIPQTQWDMNPKPDQNPGD